jgi:hypothetical protein
LFSPLAYGMDETPANLPNSTVHHLKKHRKKNNHVDDDADDFACSEYDDYYDYDHDGDADGYAESVIDVEFFLKYNGRVLNKWNSSYLISDVVPVNMTLSGGLFDDLVNLDNSNSIRGIVGAIIILGFVLLFSFSRDITITAIGGLVGLSINWINDLLPKNLLSVSIIVIGLLIISDNIGGNN